MGTERQLFSSPDLRSLMQLRSTQSNPKLLLDISPQLSTVHPIPPLAAHQPGTLAACALPSCPSCLMVLALACALCTHPDTAPDPGPDTAQALSFTKYCNACLLPLLFFVDEPVMVAGPLEL